MPVKVKKNQQGMAAKGSVLRMHLHIIFLMTRRERAGEGGGINLEHKIRL
jgi:hypothetical protein